MAAYQLFRTSIGLTVKWSTFACPSSIILKGYSDSAGMLRVLDGDPSWTSNTLPSFPNVVACNMTAAGPEHLF